MRISLWAGVAVVITVASSVSMAVAPHFAAYPLSFPGGGGFINDFNNYGQFIGYDAGTTSGAFFWTPNVANGTAGQVKYFNNLMPGQISTEAVTLNNSGSIVVEVATSPHAVTSMLWTPQSPNGTAGTYAELNPAFAYGMNDSGQLVGSSGPSGGFLWTPTTPNGSTGVSTAVNPSPGYAVAYPNAINNAGAMAGVQDPGPNHRAFAFVPTQPNGSTGTTQLLPLVAGATKSSAEMINDDGWVVGYNSQSASNVAHATLWRPDMAAPGGYIATDLGVLPGPNANSFAKDINKNGWITGFSSAVGPDFRSFLWTPADGLLDIRSLIDTPLSSEIVSLAPVGLNDRNDILLNVTIDPGQTGNQTNYQMRTYLLKQVVPEPATAMAALTAAVAFGRRRRTPSK